jgi:predicted phosphate transport protein (TIGR00153 family)
LARFRLIPREERFFTDLVAMVDAIAEGAAIFEAMLASDPPLLARAGEVQAIEHRCDELTHAIVERLNRTFVTPIDREDIHALAKSLDDVMDAIDAAAAVTRRYRMSQLRYGARELASLTWQSAMQVKVAVEALERRTGVHQLAVEVNRLENAADDVHDEALRRLFEEEKDAITLIKWKEVLDLLEEATDRCEDCANVLESVVVKHG